MKILDIFGLDVYRDGETLPDKRFWIPRSLRSRTQPRARPCPAGHANDVGEIRPDARAVRARPSVSSWLRSPPSPSRPDAS